MIEFVFTLDYEIYGNGTGALRDLVYDPANTLRQVFRKWDTPFLAFIEVLELEKIEAFGTDPAIDIVKKQIRELFQDGHEIGLHLHPQWCNGYFEGGRWFLDESEYNLCVLPRPRIETIVQSSLKYLRHVVNQSPFTPLSFRAGNWLFQPTATAASVISENGIRIDSSVFKGGLQHHHTLDYRRSLRNGEFWSFGEDVNMPDPKGPLFELPIYTEMVPFWRLFTSKRLGLGSSTGVMGQRNVHKLVRIRDFLRFYYPLKLDFCRMTLGELVSVMNRVIQDDKEHPEAFRPVVAIGHTKDLRDIETVDSFLAFLKKNRIAVSTFRDICPKLTQTGCTV